MAFLASCIPANVGDPCGPTSELGYDDTHILNCQDGRYGRYVTREVALVWWKMVFEAQAAAEAEAAAGNPPGGGPPPPPQTGPLLVKKVATGNDFSCALRTDGRVKCWGTNKLSILGVGGDNFSSIPVEVGGITAAIDIEAGRSHACVILTNRTVKCWGFNKYGETGSGGGLEIATPVVVPNVNGATAIAASRGGIFQQTGSTCAIVTGGAIKCWGNNVHGQLGDGTKAQSIAAVNVSGITGATDVAVGGHFACAVIGGGAIKCWGNNSAGQLGRPGLGSTTPVSVVDSSGTPVTGLDSVSAGTEHACARSLGDAVGCWGRDAEGQLGDGTLLQNRSFMAVVPGLNAVTNIGMGTYHSCAVIVGGQARCWGDNGEFQLGAIADGRSAVPIDVQALFAAFQIAGGFNHSCAARSGTRIVNCWGLNSLGQLGNGSVHNSINAVPTFPI